MSDIICGVLSYFGVDRSACQKVLWGAPSDGAVGCKTTQVKKEKSPPGFPSKPTWELAEEETKILHEFLKDIYTQMPGVKLVKEKDGSPRFVEVTSWVNIGEGDREIPKPIKTFRVTTEPDNNLCGRDKLQEIKQKLSKMIESKQANLDGKSLKVTDFEIKIETQVGSAYGPEYYWITIIPYAVEIRKD